MGKAVVGNRILQPLWARPQGHTDVEEGSGPKAARDREQG